MMKKIRAEVGVAFGGSEGGTWEIFEVEIPAVAEEQIERFAIEKVKRKLEGQNARNIVAGLWLYYYEGIEGD